MLVHKLDKEHNQTLSFGRRSAEKAIPKMNEISQHFLPHDDFYPTLAMETNPEEKEVWNRHSTEP